MPTYRVSLEKRVCADFEFLVSAKDEAEAIELAKLRNDPDSVRNHFEQGSEYVRTLSIHELNLPQAVAMQQQEDDEYEDEEDPDDDDRCSRCDRLYDNCCCCETCDEYLCVCEPEDEDEEEDEENQPAAASWTPRAIAPAVIPDAPAVASEESFGPDDANWTHHVNSSLLELPDAARAAFEYLVVETDIDLLYDLIWAARGHAQAVRLLTNYLETQRTSEIENVAAREYLMLWVEENRKHLPSLVNMIAAYGRETVKCVHCKRSVPAKTAHLHQGDWIGDECCWDEQLRSSA